MPPRREIQIKHWTRAKKRALVDGDRERLHTLAKRRGRLQAASAAIDHRFDWTDGSQERVVEPAG